MVVRVAHEVNVAQALLVVDGVEAAARVLVGEPPAALLQQPVDHGDVDDRLEPLELADHERAARPRARERHVDVVPPGLGLEARAAVRRDELPEQALLAHVRAARVQRRHPRQLAHQRCLEDDKRN